MNGKSVLILSNEPSVLYQNDLVAQDRTQDLDNGEPFLHAAWRGALVPKSGDSVTHIGAGSGY